MITINKIKLAITLTAVLTTFTVTQSVGQKQLKLKSKSKTTELTRKDHLDQITTYFLAVSDEIWKYTSAIANLEDAVKLEKRRRALGKFLYEQDKEVVEYGDYKGDKVMYDALRNYIEECKTLMQDEYKKIVPLYEVSKKSPENMDKYLDMLTKVNSDLSAINEHYMKVDLPYRSKYFSFKTYKIKGVKQEDLLPENKIETVLETYESFKPIYVSALKSKRLEKKLYKAFQKGDTVKCHTIMDTLRQQTAVGNNFASNIEYYQKDTILHSRFLEVLNYHDKLCNEIMPKMMNYYGKQQAFNKVYEKFGQRDQKEITPEEYDEMEIETMKINDVNNKFNVLFNDYVYDRSDKFYRFDLAVKSFLGKHIVREK